MLESFDEAFYVASNSDVAEGIQAGWLASGRDHYIITGSGKGGRPFALDPAWYAAQYPMAQTEVPHGNYTDFTTITLPSARRAATTTPG